MATGTAGTLVFLSQESQTPARGVGGLRVPAPVTMDFCCELSGHTRSFIFKVEEEDYAEHVLALTVLCLTEGAKDECNVVEGVARNHDHWEIAVPAILPTHAQPGRLPAPTTCNFPPEVRLWPCADPWEAPDCFNEQ
ncbi:Nucleoplasmin-3 [Saguinus oedipus]|uniref:Nucleoplasmin-3 n=1 Tax=Saguinus oedipus TaxID=9490 RepID=A0ABQ9W0L5_SAGOE|nr:Nucleoplasmin-3 [Saguinus oedipus]